ncbi:MAG: WecB/TagA/CpsF family glycosyltransferase [Spirochaetales bacterium]|nr:WecB/TagA/CpsF family glycosyltransferase [Spirochaetales bacterium]
MKRVIFLNTPVDAVDKETATNLILECLNDSGRHHFVFLTVDKILKARVDSEFRRCLREATLVLPVSRAIAKGVKFHRRVSLTRYYPYEFIIHLLTIMEQQNKSVYLLGSEQNYLIEAEKNLKVSFPKIKIIGRFSGFFGQDMEPNILLSIKKSSPSLLIVGKGVSGKEKWIFRNKDAFKPGIFIWVDNYLDIFAGKEKNVSKKLFDVGLESLSGLSGKPWRLLKIFPYLYFKFLVLLYKIMGY